MKRRSGERGRTGEERAKRPQPWFRVFGALEDGPTGPIRFFTPDDLR